MLTGECAPWPTKEQMATILRNAGLTVVVGKYSLRVKDCAHFSFEHYGSDISDPGISAEADTAKAMIADGHGVSAALAAARIRHRFEVDDAEDRLVAYLHYDWPSTGEQA